MNLADKNLIHSMIIKKTELKISTADMNRPLSIIIRSRFVIGKIKNQG
jgi:hypothetical protein